MTYELYELLVNKLEIKIIVLKHISPNVIIELITIRQNVYIATYYDSCFPENIFLILPVICHFMTNRNII